MYAGEVQEHKDEHHQDEDARHHQKEDTHELTLASKYVDLGYVKVLLAIKRDYIEPIIDLNTVCDACIESHVMKVTPEFVEVREGFHLEPDHYMLVGCVHPGLGGIKAAELVLTVPLQCDTCLIDGDLLFHTFFVRDIQPDLLHHPGWSSASVIFGVNDDSLSSLIMLFLIEDSPKFVRNIHSCQFCKSFGPSICMHSE